MATIAGLGLAAVGVVTALLIVRAARRRRERRRQEELRRRAAEAVSNLPLGSTGALAVAATLEGIKLATRVGAEVSRAGLAPVLAGSLRRLAEMAEEDRPALRRIITDDGHMTLLFSDIEGSTELNQELGDARWLEVLHDHDTAVRRQVRRHRGEVIKTQGDSFMVAFRDAPAAVGCAVAVQRAFEDEPTDPPVRVRIGVHTGEVTRQGRDVFGLNVALAARVAAEARGGEVLVTDAVRTLAGDAEEFRFGRARTLRLKGIAESATVYPVRASA